MFERKTQIIKTKFYNQYVNLWRPISQTKIINIVIKFLLMSVCQIWIKTFYNKVKILQGQRK